MTVRRWCGVVWEDCGMKPDAIVRTVVWNCLGGLWCGIVEEDSGMKSDAIVTVVWSCLFGRKPDA